MQNSTNLQTDCETIFLMPEMHSPPNCKIRHRMITSLNHVNETNSACNGLTTDIPDQWYGILNGYVFSIICSRGGERVEEVIGILWYIPPYLKSVMFCHYCICRLLPHLYRDQTRQHFFELVQEMARQ